MSRLLRMLIPAVGVASLLAGPVFSAGLAKSGYMERVITTRVVGASLTQTEKFYWEGDRLRSEKYGMDGLLIEIKDGKTLYLYNPGQKEAIKMVVPDKYGRSVQQILQEQGGPPKGGKKVGSKRIAGFDCDVYALSKMVGNLRKSAKLYVSRDRRLPIALKIEIAMGSGSQTVETRNVKLSMNVPDSMFALPKGTKVTEKKFTVPGQPAPGAPN